MTEIAPKSADPRLRPAPHGRTNLATLLAAGALTAAIFGSRVVLQEIETKPDMAGYETLRHAGLLWDDTMRYLHATAPDTALHDGIRRIEGRRF